MINNCPVCNSDNIYFSKKRNIQVCEDCGNTFTIEKKFVPQHIFLSYGHDKNSVVVSQIKSDLEKRGHFVWIDKTEIKTGQDWRNNIYKGIVDSSQFLSFLSVHSTRIPGVCLDEIAIAVGIRGCNIKTILLEKDVQAPISISNIQWLDMSDWNKHYKKGGLDWDRWYGENLREIIRIVENEENQVFTGEITHLEKKLHPTSFETKLKLLLKNDFYGRKWLLDEVDKWYKEDNNSRMFWLLGGPGVGKSAFIARLAHYFSCTAAMQFCEWDKKDSSNPKQIIKTIAFQLATKLTDYRKVLISLLNKEDFDSMSPDRLFDYLLIEPLNSLIDGGRERQIILIDALDEVSSEFNNSFVKLLAININKFPRWIGFIITSRPEAAVIDPLRAFKPLILEVDSEENKVDILLYINKTLEKIVDENKLNEVANLIYQKSGGIFLYAKEVVAEIIAGNININELECFPQGMAGIYWHTFERLFVDFEFYNQHMRPFLKIIIAGKESIPLNIIKDILKITSEKLNDVVIKLQSFFPKVIENNQFVVRPYHKSINEWLTSTNSGKYFIESLEGHEIIALYGLELFRKEKKEIPLYFVKHFTAHLKDTNRWYSLPYLEKQKILKDLIAESLSIGYKYLEFNYILMLEDLIGITEKVTVLFYKLKYYSRTSGTDIIAIANELLAEIDNILDDDLKATYLIEISVAYFYIGLHDKGIDILNKIETIMSPNYFDNDYNKARLYHTYGLFMHDIDKNATVVSKSKVANHSYKVLDITYEEMITRVNLFDGLMGISKLDEAEQIALSIFKDNEKANLIHVTDMLNLCYANLLLTQGKIMEAFDYYEKGLALAEIIEHEWDYIYGRIWRELCLAKIGDKSALENLQEIKEITIQKNYSYLEALAVTFYMISSHILGIKLTNKEAQRVFDFVSNAQTPGLFVQTMIIILLDDYSINLCQDDLINLLIRTTLECEGIKGAPEVFIELLEKYDLENYENYLEFNKWISDYITPCIDYRKELENQVFSGLEIKPKLKSFRCRDCEAHCCYDGVYISEDDEIAINNAVRSYPEYFKHLPKDYIIDGNWRNLMQGRKTNVINYSYSRESFPKHFTQTRCVFAYENGECSLQRAATNNLLNPWKFKPMSCWLFPIKAKENSLQPPLKDNEDPFNIGSEYPGYISYLPCGQISDAGQKWSELYKNEILYFNYISKKRNEK